MGLALCRTTGMISHCLSCDPAAGDRCDKCLPPMRCRGGGVHRDLMNPGSCQLLQGALRMLSQPLFKESRIKASHSNRRASNHALITGP